MKQVWLTMLLIWGQLGDATLSPYTHQRRYPAGYQLSGQTEAGPQRTLGDNGQKTRAQVTRYRPLDGTRYQLTYGTGYQSMKNKDKYVDNIGYHSAEDKEHQFTDGTGHQSVEDKYQYVHYTGYHSAEDKEHQHTDGHKAHGERDPEPKTRSRIRRARRRTRQHYRHSKRRYMMGGKYRPHKQYRG